jgi:hypothetical protein
MNSQPTCGKSLKRTIGLAFGTVLALCSSADVPQPAQTTNAPAIEAAKPKPNREAEKRYPAARQSPFLRRDWDAYQTRAEADAPEDEAKSGFTAAGTPVNQREMADFPIEQRNLFWEVDQVYDPKTQDLVPFDYRNEVGILDDLGAKAIMGQNTWMLWGEGNEEFWDWLQQHGYGLVDFMVLLDSRQRGERFKRTGMINQPGMMPGPRNSLGLWLDIASDEKVLKEAKDIKHATTGKRRGAKLAGQPEQIRMNPPDGVEGPPPEASASQYGSSNTPLFTPGNPALYEKVLAELPRDGVDPKVYGYPSGVIGLRLFPNPDFFGRSEPAQQARERWDEKVTQDKTDRYYKDSDYARDPTLVRPFRVAMTCAFCHIAPHPLDPPDDVENPSWENLSSVIGNQYWTPPAIFTNLINSRSLLYQYLNSQQPGTVDTSMISTDHINNSNTITAVFDVPARLERAKGNESIVGNLPEKQSAANLQIPSIEELSSNLTPRHTPRALIDGADSVGFFGSLSRVYLNIGAHSREWARGHNPIFGFRAQRPFSVATLKKKSVYWQAGDEERIPALAEFFRHVDMSTGRNVASPMKLAELSRAAAIGYPEARARLEEERADAAAGRTVFLSNCAICHSSKQPKGFELAFSEDWRDQDVPYGNQPMKITLPRAFEDWEEFRKSRAFLNYAEVIRRQAQVDEGAKDTFFENNFLSNEVRIPVSLVGTNSGRAVATNAMRGQIWDNFSSADYKNLEAVGPVRFFNPYLVNIKVDAWGNNDSYFPPRGGPGYYRPASLISLWATAPYLHNNALGIFNRDPSVKGRLDAFDDAIGRMFDREKRLKVPTDIKGDLRPSAEKFELPDYGLIYRTTQTTRISIPASFIRPLFTGLLGESGFSFVSTWLWWLLGSMLLVLFILARQRHVAFIFLLAAVAVALLIVIGRFDTVTLCIWGAPALLLGIAIALSIIRPRRWLARIFFALFAIKLLAVGFTVHGFVNGRGGPIDIGPIPKGTPINLIMNMNPDAPLGYKLRAVTALAKGLYVTRNTVGEGQQLREFEKAAGQALIEASKCPDFVLDRGHWFAEGLSVEEKRQLKAFLLTL